MTRKTLTLAAAGLAATSLVLSACGSDSSKDNSGGGGGKAGTVASKMILGGPPEFQTRVDGVPGLRKVYGVTFQSFQTTDTGGPVTVTALKNGQVDAADLFTTDPAIKANNFVVLTDPKSNFGAQNVLPLINKDKASQQVTDTLNAVSAKLTTQTLLDLDKQVITDKKDPTEVAKSFVSSNGLG